MSQGDERGVRLRLNGKRMRGGEFNSGRVIKCMESIGKRKSRIVRGRSFLGKAPEKGELVLL